jgi:hypothetical protein
MLGLGSVVGNCFSQACHRCGKDTCGHSFCSHRHAGDDANRQQISLHPQEGTLCSHKSYRGLSHCLSTPLFILSTFSILVKQSSNFHGYSVEQMLMGLKWFLM